jgi:hypothetical protein
MALVLPAVIASACTKDSVLPTPLSPTPDVVPVALSFAPRGVVGGTAVTATLALNLPAPASGLAVALASDSALATVPGGVTVPPGATQVSFPVTTRVPSNDGTAVITATKGTVNRSGALVVWKPEETAYTWDADPGNYVGAGRFDRFTPANASFQAWCDQSWIDVRVNTSRGSWSVLLGAPSGTPLRPGSYVVPDTTSGFGAPGKAGMSIGGESRSCGTGGTFVISEADFTTEGRVRTFRASFELQCQSNVFTRANLRGEIALSNVPSDSTSLRSCLR